MDVSNLGMRPSYPYRLSVKPTPDRLMIYSEVYTEMMKTRPIARPIHLPWEMWNISTRQGVDSFWLERGCASGHATPLHLL